MSVIVPRRKDDFFQPNGEPTLRFVKFLEELTGQSNEVTEKTEAITEIITNVEQAAFASGFSSYLQQTIRQLNGLPEFTIDTTGFTADSTLITSDKVIA